MLLVGVLSGCVKLLGIDDPRDLALDRVELRVGGQLIPLTPAFDPAIKSYTATVSPTDQVTVTAVSSDGDIELKIGLMTIRGETLTENLAVRPGSTKVVNVRAALDNGFAVNYGIVVTIGGADFGAPIPTVLPMNQFMVGGKFDGDGLADLVIFEPGQAKVILGQADGTFNIGPPPTSLTGLSCSDAASGDIDDNGTPDIVAACNDRVAVLLNGLGNAQLATPVTTSLGAAGFLRIAVGELTNDTRDDVAVAATDGVLKTLVSVGPGVGTLQPHTTAPPFGPNPNNLAIGHLDAPDGGNDVVVSNPAELGVYKNTSLGDGPADHDLPNSGGMVAIGDFDGLAGLDHAVIDNGPIPRLAVVTRLFAGPVTDVIDLVNAQHPLAVAVADLDDDGKDDIVLATDAGLDLVFGGTSLKQFPFIATTPMPNLKALVIADFTGDGRLDIAVGHSTGVMLYPGIKP